MNDLHYLSRVCAKRDHMRIKSKSEHDNATFHNYPCLQT